MRSHERTTSKEHRAYFEAEAKKAFAEHELVPEGEGRWLVRKPGTGIYHFRVIFSPGAVFLYGDIYDLVLICNDRDSLSWLRTSPHLDYALGKCPRPKKVFMPGDAEAYLKEWEENEDYGRKETVAKIRELWEDYRMEDDRYEPAQAWRMAVYEVTQDCEIPECDDWDGQMLYQWWGLQKFCELLDAEEKRKQAEEQERLAAGTLAEEARKGLLPTLDEKLAVLRALIKEHAFKAMAPHSDQMPQLTDLAAQCGLVLKDIRFEKKLNPVGDMAEYVGTRVTVEIEGRAEPLVLDF